MNRLVNEKAVRLIAQFLVWGFLIIHVILLAVFLYFHVLPMAVFNVFSIGFYLSLSVVVKKRGVFRNFAVCVYLEVLLHMSAAVVFTGWESGFQNTLIGMGVTLFYFEYAAHCLKMPHQKSLPYCILGLISYVSLCIHVHCFPPKYPLPLNVAFYFQVFWGVIVFAITISLLYIFASLSVGTYEFLTQRVRHDQLTDLPNRYFLFDYLEELQRETEMEGYWAALIDIDDFKKINDTYGHNCGDAVLKGVAPILQESFAGDAVCRWGGEEFILIGKPDENLEQKLNRLRKTIENHTFFFDTVQLHITVTIGVADYRPEYDIRRWIGEADQRMYQGKMAGKNRVVVLTEPESKERRNSYTALQTGEGDGEDEILEPNRKSWAECQGRLGW